MGKACKATETEEDGKAAGSSPSDVRVLSRS
jgi:hypothetical protein